MEKKKILSLVVAAVIVIGGAALFFSQKKEQPRQTAVRETQPQSVSEGALGSIEDEEAVQEPEKKAPVIPLEPGAVRTQDISKKTEPKTVPSAFAAPEVKKEAAGKEAASTKTKSFVVRISGSGYEPQTLAVPLGSKVEFKNESGRAVWTASDIHPTHGLYPKKGGCLGSLFDACRGVASGESWTFLFEEKGAWSYHDHLNPSVRGSVTVE